MAGVYARARTPRHSGSARPHWPPATATASARTTTSPSAAFLLALRPVDSQGSAPETLAHMRVRGRRLLGVLNHPGTSSTHRPQTCLAVIASFRQTAGASAVLAVCLLVGCGGAGETQTTGVQGPPEPRAASPAASREGPGEGGQIASAGKRTPALVPDDFERRVLGDRQDAGAVIAPLASGGIKVFGRRGLRMLGRRSSR